MDAKVRRITIAAVVIVVFITLIFSTRNNKQVEIDSGYRLVMGTFARIVALAEDSDTALNCIEAGMAQIDKVDELMSDYKSDSEISLVNQNGFNEPVQVGQATYEVLKKSIEFSRLTDGAFDITVGPLVDVFKSIKENHTAVDEEQIAQAKSKVGYEKLKLDDQNRTVKLTVEGMRLDLGGIAKGYAVDKAIEAMKQSGAIGGMIDLGGDIRCFGAPPKGKKSWLIGLQNPDIENENARNELVLTLTLTDEAAATSGDYRQFAIIEEKRRSHIIDRATGKSAQGLSSVTVIAKNATDADALATAVSVMGPEKGLALIEKTPDTEAILITSGPDYKIIETSGAKKYIKE